MQSSAAALRLISASEGLKTSPYLDTAKIYTVGWGHALTTVDGKNIDVDVFGAQKALELAHDAMQRKYGMQTITQVMADATLKEDLATTEHLLASRLPADTAQSQYDALCSFTFNLGPSNFDSSAIKRFHLNHQRTVGQLSLTTLCSHSKNHQPPTNMAEAFAAWSNSNHLWTLGLFRRRIAEVLVYSGWDADKAVQTAWAFHD